MDLSWAWTHNHLNVCPATYPLHHSDQLIMVVEETSHSEEIVKCNSPVIIWTEISVLMDDSLKLFRIKNDQEKFLSEICST